MKTFKVWRNQLGGQANFLIAAVILSAVAVILSIYLLTSLVSSLGDVLGIQTKPVPARQFNTEGFEKLNLMK